MSRIRTACATALALALAAPLAAGVVFEVETTEHDASPPRVESSQMSVEGKNLAMDVPPSPGSRSGGKAIFRGDRREMVIVDHDTKSYVVVDEAAMQQLAGQLAGVSKQIEEALKNVPEEQRAMVEKMMKERMPQQAPAAPALDIRRTGERAEQAGYPCVKYEVLRDGAKVRELWVTDWGNVEGGSEAAGAFVAMAEFMSDLLDSLPVGAGAPGGLGDSVVAQMKEIDGFPVVTREFDAGGELESESTLRSSSRRTLDPAEFEPPAGYKRRSMFGG